MDGGWTNWSNWGTCSTTCGYGQKRRFRSCSNPSPEYGGLDCSGDNTELMNCFGGNCTGTEACLFESLFIYFLFGPAEHKLRYMYTEPLNIRTYFLSEIIYYNINYQLNIVDISLRIKHQLLIFESCE